MNMNEAEPSSVISTWEDLSSLKTYIILGEVYAEQGTKGMDVESVKNYAQMFKILARDVHGVGIGIREIGLLEIAKNHPDSEIRINSAPLAQLPMYHYIHQSHAHIVPQLQETLRAMYETGEIQKLNQDAMAQMLAKP